MKHLCRCAATLFAFSLIALTTGPAPAVIRPTWGGSGKQNISGMYSGSVSDSALGTGTAVANFVETGGTGGNQIGGYLNSTFGSATYTSPVESLSRHRGGGQGGNGQWQGGALDDRGGALLGIFETIVGSAACTFAFKANFDSSSYELSGEYRAIVGCSGESGTFLLTQQCYYAQRGDLRRNTGSGPGACS
jgi:hypothetical protein